MNDEDPRPDSSKAGVRGGDTSREVRALLPRKEDSLSGAKRETVGMAVVVYRTLTTATLRYRHQNRHREPAGDD